MTRVPIGGGRLTPGVFRLGGPATAPATQEVLAERIAWSRREHAFVRRHRDVFDRELRADPR